MRTITQTIKLLLCALPFVLIATASPVYAYIAPPSPTATKTNPTQSTTGNCSGTASSSKSSKGYNQNPSGYCTAPTAEDPAVTGGNCAASLTNCDLIVKFVKPFIEFMTALVGVAVVFSIIVGGIQYSSSADDPAKVGAAKNRIRNAIIALLVYFFLYALLSFLLPGGLSNLSYLW